MSVHRSQIDPQKLEWGQKTLELYNYLAQKLRKDTILQLEADAREENGFVEPDYASPPQLPPEASNRKARKKLARAASQPDDALAEQLGRTGV